MNNLIVTDTDRVRQLPKNPEYRTRLKRKAIALLKRKGDRPLRNQQQRLISKARKQGLLGGLSDAA